MGTKKMRCAGMLVTSVLGVLACWSRVLAEPPSPCAGEPYRAMDFWLGDWNVDWKMSDGRSGRGENHIVKDYKGCVVIERYQDHTTDFAGTSLSNYSIYSKQWIQTWMDNTGSTFEASGGAVAGSPAGFVMSLRHYSDKQPFSRIVFEDVGKDTLTWRFQNRSSATAPWVDATVSKYTREPAAHLPQQTFSTPSKILSPNN